jgi:hypothetical protein
LRCAMVGHGTVGQLASMVSQRASQHVWKCRPAWPAKQKQQHTHTSHTTQAQLHKQTHFQTRWPARQAPLYCVFAPGQFTERSASGRRCASLIDEKLRWCGQLVSQFDVSRVGCGDRAALCLRGRQSSRRQRSYIKFRSKQGITESAIWSVWSVWSVLVSFGQFGQFF